MCGSKTECGWNSSIIVACLLPSPPTPAGSWVGWWTSGQVDYLVSGLVDKWTSGLVDYLAIGLVSVCTL